MNTVNKQRLIELCKMKLLEKRAELLNQFQTYKADFNSRQSGGDEVDQSVELLRENQMLAAHQRLRHLIVEIDSALARIETGRFGLCEETNEPIEPQRLLAIPWTRVSLEGAEIRESTSSRIS